MAGAMRKVAVYLGLVEDQDRYDDEYAEDTYDEYGDEFADQAPAVVPRFQYKPPTMTDPAPPR